MFGTIVPTPAAAAAPVANAPAPSIDAAHAASTAATQQDTMILRSVSTLKRGVENVEVADQPQLRWTPTSRDLPHFKRIRTSGVAPSLSVVNSNNEDDKDTTEDVAGTRTGSAAAAVRVPPTPSTPRFSSTAVPGSALESTMGSGAVLGTEAFSGEAGVALRYAAAVDYVDGDAAETVASAYVNVVERYMWLYTGLKNDYASLLEECQMLAKTKQELNGEISKLHHEMQQASFSIKLKALKNDSKLDSAIANLVTNPPMDESRGVVKMLFATCEGMAFAEQVKGKVTAEIAKQQSYLAMQTNKFRPWKAELSKMDDEIAELKAKYEMELNEKDETRKKHMTLLGEM
jgi:hypothetical protein